MSTIPKGSTDNYSKHVKKIDEKGNLKPHPRSAKKPSKIKPMKTPSKPSGVPKEIKPSKEYYEAHNTAGRSLRKNNKMFRESMTLRDNMGRLRNKGKK